MKKLIILLLVLLIIMPFSVYARPNPQKQTAEVLNDVMNSTEDALNVSTKPGQTLTVAIGGTLGLGASMDFSVTNITDAAFVDFATLTADTAQVDITHNGGGTFILKVDAAEVGVIAPGHVTLMGFSNDAGAVISIKSKSGTVSAGSLFMNFIQ